MHYTFKPRLVSVLLTLIVCSSLANLGVWQLNRSAIAALQKLKNINLYRTTFRTLDIYDLIRNANTTTGEKDQGGLAGSHVKLHGKLQPENALVLESVHPVTHEPGYEVYIPLVIFGSQKSLLVSKGFETTNNPTLSGLSPQFGQRSLSGILDTPPPELQKKLNLTNYYDYILYLDHNHFLLHNQDELYPSINMNYAMEFFGFAIMIFLLSLINSLKKANP